MTGRLKKSPLLDTSRAASVLGTRRRIGESATATRQHGTYIWATRNEQPAARCVSTGKPHCSNPSLRARITALHTVHMSTHTLHTIPSTSPLPGPSHVAGRHTATRQQPSPLSAVSHDTRVEQTVMLLICRLLPCAWQAVCRPDAAKRSPRPSPGEREAHRASPAMAVPQSVARRRLTLTSRTSSSVCVVADTRPPGTTITATALDISSFASFRPSIIPHPLADGLRRPLVLVIRLWPGQLDRSAFAPASGRGRPKRPKGPKPSSCWPASTAGPRGRSALVCSQRDAVSGCGMHTNRASAYPHTPGTRAVRLFLEGWQHLTALSHHDEVWNKYSCADCTSYSSYSKDIASQNQ
ncbi:hypothetical protein M011DRAFT_123960 [Sporormia fimetaria CBS 119925]|uniref:Uncharacterized protein n=1 Tax=Sporormia fimetaria CBS 119925 TaxID=1340428 RepID=A0A6A6V9M1_9PLEO|nr:hypothetical protein M011DRAFT_123960 [Sporormia fimetaria CBS 119925]